MPGQANAAPAESAKDTPKADAPSPRPATGGRKKEPDKDDFGIDQKRMTFAEHLIELRARIIICLATVIVAFLVFFLAIPTRLYEVLLRPANVAAERVVRSLAEEAGEAAAKRALAAVQKAGGAALDPHAIAKAAVGDLQGVDPKVIAEGVAKVVADAGDKPVEPKALADAVAEVVGRTARFAVDRQGFLIADTPVAVIVTDIFLCLAAAIALTVPVTGYELWAFVAPGLKQRERRFIVPILLVGTGLFALGALFAYLVALPISLNFLMHYTVTHEGVRVLWRMGETVQFEAIILIGMGLAFELPLVIVALARVGIVSPKTLAKYRRHAILIIFVVTAIVSPTVDMVTELVLAGPLVLLYEISIQASKFFAAKSTIWGPWDEKDYGEMWETSVAPADLAPTSSSAEAQPTATASTESAAQPPAAVTGEAASPDTPPGAPAPTTHEQPDDSYEQQTYDTTAPYAYGENAYQLEEWEKKRQRDEALDRLRKDLKRRRASRRPKHPGPGRTGPRHRRPNT
jgi:sec-independent protein translocase protein TatC